jgi:hypothetical protein
LLSSGSPPLSSDRFFETAISDCEHFAEQSYEECFHADTACVVANHTRRFARSTSNCSCSAIPHEFGDTVLEDAEVSAAVPPHCSVGQGLVLTARSATPPHPQHAVAWTSVAILSIFVLEGLLHWLELGWHFLSDLNGMHAVDLVIVIVALVFEAGGLWSRRAATAASRRGLTRP